MRTLFSLSTFCAALLAGSFFAVSPAKAEMGDAFTGAYVSGEVGLTSGLEQDIVITDVVTSGTAADPLTEAVSGDPFSFGASVGYGVMASELMGDAMGDTPIYFGGELSAFFSLLDEDSAHANVEETWNIQIAGDVGYVVQEDILAFVRIGYLFSGADSALIAPATADAYDDDEDTASSAEDSSFLIGVGGTYAMQQDFNLRGMVVFHTGDRSGTEFRVGAAWRF